MIMDHHTWYQSIDYCANTTIENLLFEHIMELMERRLVESTTQQQRDHYRAMMLELYQNSPLSYYQPPPTEPEYEPYCSYSDCYNLHHHSTNNLHDFSYQLSSSSTFDRNFDSWSLLDDDVAVLSKSTFVVLDLQETSSPSEKCNEQLESSSQPLTCTPPSPNEPPPSEDMLDLGMTIIEASEVDRTLVTSEIGKNDERNQQAVVCKLSLGFNHAGGSVFFEYLQGEAESGLERLHQCAEKDLECYLKTDGPLKEFNEFQTKFAGLTSMTRNYFESLVRALKNGLSDVDSRGASSSSRVWEAKALKQVATTINIQPMKLNFILLMLEDKHLEMGESNCYDPTFVDEMQDAALQPEQSTSSPTGALLS